MTTRFLNYHVKIEVINTLDKISNATVFKFEYFSFGIKRIFRYYVNDLGYVESFCWKILDSGR